MVTYLCMTSQTEQHNTNTLENIPQSLKKMKKFQIYLLHSTHTWQHLMCSDYSNYCTPKIHSLGQSELRVLKKSPQKETGTGRRKLESGEVGNQHFYIFHNNTRYIPLMWYGVITYIWYKCQTRPMRKVYVCVYMCVYVCVCGGGGGGVTQWEGSKSTSENTICIRRQVKFG